MKPGHYKMKRLSLSLCSADSRLDSIFELFCQIIQNANYGLRSAWKSLFSVVGWGAGEGGWNSKNHANDALHTNIAHSRPPHQMARRSIMVTIQDAKFMLNTIL